MYYYVNINNNSQYNNNNGYRASTRTNSNSKISNAMACKLEVDLLTSMQLWKNKKVSYRKWIARLHL